MPAIGLAAETLGINGQGHAVVFGVIKNVDTTGYSINGTVFVAPNGGLTGTKPTGANDQIQNVGRVVRVHASTGEILVSAIGRSNDVPNILQARSYLLMPNGQTATSVVTTWNGASGPVNLQQLCFIQCRGRGYSGQFSNGRSNHKQCWCYIGQRCNGSDCKHCSNQRSSRLSADCRHSPTGLSSGSTITVNNAVQGLTNSNSLVLRTAVNKFKLYHHRCYRRTT
jgi:hypothetical protein